jgi:hypothetical protein
VRLVVDADPNHALPDPPVIGPLIVAAGPVGAETVARDAGAVDDDVGVAERDGDDDDEQPASTSTPANAQLTSNPTGADRDRRCG